MALKDIVLRITAHPPLTNKGGEISWAEEDNNFIQIYEAIMAIINAGGTIDIYDPLLPYVAGNNYIVFDDGDGEALYRCIINTVAGQNPGSSPAKWQREGETYVKITKVQLDSLVDDHELEQKKLYEITNAVSGTKRIIVFGFTAAATSSIAINLTDNVIGNYNYADDTFTPGDFATYFKSLPGYVDGNDNQGIVCMADGSFQIKQLTIA